MAAWVLGCQPATTHPANHAFMNADMLFSLKSFSGLIMFIIFVKVSTKYHHSLKKSMSTI